MILSYILGHLTDFALLPSVLCKREGRLRIARRSYSPFNRDFAVIIYDQTDCLL